MAPGAVTDLAATAVNGARIQLDWTAAPGAESYAIYRSTSKTGTFLWLADSATNSFVDDTCSLGGTYYYKVRAFASGTSEKVYGLYSNVVNAKAVLGKVENITATAVAYNQIDVTWDVHPTATGYMICRSNTPGSSGSVIADVTTNSYSDTTVTVGTTYFYTVIPYYSTDGVIKVLGDEDTQTAGVTTTLGTVSGVKVTCTGTSQAKITWKAVDGAQGYEIYRATEKDGEYIHINSVEGLSYEDAGLALNQAYYYKVRAYVVVENESIFGDFSAYDGERILPAKVTGVVADAASPVKANITWKAVVGADGYVIYRSTSKTGSYKQIAEATETSYVDDSVICGKAYYYKVKAYALDGNGERVYGTASSYDGVRTALGTVKNVKVASVNPTKLKVTWSKVSGASGYVIYRSTSKSGTYKQIATVTGTSYTDSELTCGKAYYYKVKAYADSTGGRGYGTASSYDGEKPMPGKVTDLEAKSASPTKVKLTWDKVSGAKGYVVYRATSKSGTYKRIAYTTKNSYTDSELTCGKTYYYKVKAWAGSSSNKICGATSSADSAKPLPAAPKTSSKATVTADTIKLSWSKVSGADGYMIYMSTSEKGTYSKIATIKDGSTKSYTYEGSGKKFFKIYAYTEVGSKQVKSEASKIVCARTLKAVKKVTVTAPSSASYLLVQWDKVSGANGYQIYYKKGANGTWKLLDTVSDGDITTYQSEKKTENHGYYVYHKVRPIYKKSGVTSYGAFTSCDASSSWASWCYPNYSVLMLSSTDYSSAMAFTFYNKGKHTVRIYADGARSVDADSSTWNRDLKLVDRAALDAGRLAYVSYVDIEPGTNEIILWGVVGNKTYYDKYTRIYYEMKYDNVYYDCMSSYYYGQKYSVDRKDFK